MITISERREHESAKSFVLRVLIDNIINTRLEPGEKLNEPELCEQLGVSRTPFREAELELAQRRLIEIRPKIGTYVSLIDAGLVEEVRHLRAVLEAEIAGMACEKLTPADLDHLWENVAMWHMYIERAQEDKIFELDKEFHLQLVSCVHNKALDVVGNIILLQLDLVHERGLYPEDDHIRSSDHQKIIDLLFSRDVEKATEFITTHIERCCVIANEASDNPLE